MAEERKRETKTLELTNTGQGLSIVHDHENNPVQIEPGQSKKVELPAKTAAKIERGSDMGGALKVGAVASAARKMTADKAEFEARQRKEREEFDAEQREQETSMRRAVLQTKADAKVAEADKAQADVNPPAKNETTQHRR